MDITILSHASRRTKSRVDLLTPKHCIVRWSVRSSLADDGKAVCLRVIGDDNCDEWFGWLPWSEIDIEGVEFGDNHLFLSGSIATNQS